MPATPRHHTPRSDRPTRGPAVAKIAAAKGRPFMPWQRDAVDVALEVDPSTGLYWYSVVVVTVPRQAGKTKVEGTLPITAASRPHAAASGTPRRPARTRRHGCVMSTSRPSPTCPPVRQARHRRMPVPAQPTSRARGCRVAGDAIHLPRVPPRDGLHSKQADAVFVDEAWAYDAAQVPRSGRPSAPR